MTLPSHYIKFGWTQGAFARDEEGNEVPSTSKKACAWCILGAMSASFKSGVDQCVYWGEVTKAINNIGISNFNDDPKTTKEQVIDILEKVEQELGLR